MGKQKDSLSVDRTEIILVDTHGPHGSMHITQDQVASIVLERATVRKLFSKTETEKLTINVRKVHPAPYLLASECGEHWQGYREALEKFAKYNTIPFENKL